MIACRELVTELWDYLDGELPAARAAAIAEHLAECARCNPQYRFEYAFLAAVARQRSLGPGPSPALVEKVAAAVLPGATAARAVPEAERWALAILRVSLGALLLVCVARFGVPAVTIVLLGLWRRWSYGAALLVHAAALFALWRALDDPWGLAVAALPACGALVTLYLLRDRETWTLDAWLGWRRPWRVVR